MSFNITIPNISSTTDRGKLEQIRSYLYQLAEQLNWALNTLENNASTVVRQTSQSTKKTESEAEAQAQASFNYTKSLIISSADIINAYYDELNEKFSGQYVAQSDFGTYAEQTSQEVTRNSTATENVFVSIQEILGAVADIESNLNEVNARIKSGVLDHDDNGLPIYGLEIGQTNEIDGVKVFNKYARFMSDKLAFYDKNDTEVAYISDYKLYITNAHISGTLTLGRYSIDTSNGLAFKWV